MLGVPAHEDYAGWVRQLGDPLLSTRAYQHLLLSGRIALPAIREGLQSSMPSTRQLSVRLLDHFVDQDSMPELASMLDDVEPLVRAEALHALSCDRCKDECVVDPEGLRERAIQVLRTDADPHVRAAACELVGKWVHSDEHAHQSLADAIANDKSPAVRKKARMYLPGGAIFQRTMPKVDECAPIRKG